MTGEGVEVLPESPDGKLAQRRLPQPLCPLVLAGVNQRPLEEPVEYRPRRPTPVAATVKPRVVGAGGGWQGPAPPPVTEKRRRIEGLEESTEPFPAQATGDQGGEARDGSHPKGTVRPQVVVEAEPELGVPATLQCSPTARHPIPDQG